MLGFRDKGRRIRLCGLFIEEVGDLRIVVFRDGG